MRLMMVLIPILVPFPLLIQLLLLPVLLLIAIHTVHEATLLMITASALRSRPLMSVRSCARHTTWTSTPSLTCRRLCIIATFFIVRLGLYHVTFVFLVFSRQAPQLLCEGMIAAGSANLRVTSRS